MIAEAVPPLSGLRGPGLGRTARRRPRRPRARSCDDRLPARLTADLYDQVDDRVNPPEGRPEGLQFHSAGPSPSGGWRVVDVWDSRDTFDRFLETKVMPVVTEIVGAEALVQGEPPKIESWTLHNLELEPRPRARAARAGAASRRDV
jgi:hypothetical protein